MKKIILLLSLFVSTSTFASPASNSLWHDVADEGSSLRAKSLSLQKPLKRRTLTLNEQGLRELLSAKKVKSRSLQAISSQTEIELPLPNGKFTRLKVFDSPILSPDIAAQYPEIKTWRVQGVDNPVISGRLDFTSKGFHGMLNMPDGDTVYIDPDKTNSKGLYHSLSKLENISWFKTEFSCQTHDRHPLLSSRNFINKDIGNSKNKEISRKELAQVPALDLITYRLAIVGTAEYTDSQGGTPTSAYASMITTINRVNEIYQRDLGIKLEIVSDSSLAYTNASTDPYSNTNAVAMVGENINNLNSNFGVANYDIGHVFAQGPLGGLAYVGATCQESYKGGGVTGIPDPQGEIFAIEFAAHEMGHQLGATHTFNSEQRSCVSPNRTAETAVEPGSGSTIMSYSGLCGTDDIQKDSDAMFHFVSISQINDYTRVEAGSSCGTRSSTGNQKPIADTGTDSTIPRSTPFILKASATGGQTYSWDQIDAGSASSVDVDMGDNAIIRMLLPSAKANRYIPRLRDLFAGTHTIGETLPKTNRDVNFAFVVRDNNGGVDADLKKITVRDTGSIFRVLSQSSDEMFTTGETVDISWSTGGTTTAPINCSKVDIQLIREDGTKNMLLENTDNDGGQSLVVPTTTPVMTNARIMIACRNQPFFQISSGNITVQEGSTSTDTTPPVITINGSSSISIVKGTSYTDAGATAQDNIDGAVTVVPSGSVNTSVVGTYTITYTATDAAGNTARAIRTVQVTEIIDNSPPIITLIGASYIEVTRGSTYIDAGATATDNIDTIVSVSKTGAVNTGVVGTYYITYTATDSSGNTATKTRTVKVTPNIAADTTSPVITLNGSLTMTMTEGDSFTDPGASAQDNIDASVTVKTTGTVDTNKPGTYVLTYTATDAAGNSSSVSRTVIIVKKNSTVRSKKSGSIGFLLLPLVLIGLRRYFIKYKAVD